MRFLACVLLAVLAGCGEKKTASGIDFAAYGDARHEPKVHRRIASSIAASGAKYVAVTGDLVDYAEDEAEWLEVRDILKDLRSRARYYCSFGDHDDGSKKYFEREMGENRPYYDVKEGDVHLFILDSRGKFADAPQLEWLKKTATASTAKHKFAVFHHPPFMIYEKRMAEADAIRPNIHPLLVQLKFCAAFCGHQHAFYSTKRDGLRYVVTAGGGAPLRNIDVKNGQPGDLARKFYHWVGLKFAGPRIDARVYDDDGVEDPSLAFTLCEHPPTQ
jgi:acid phosphatase type 7